MCSCMSGVYLCTCVLVYVCDLGVYICARACVMSICVHVCSCVCGLGVYMYAHVCEVQDY